MDKELLLYNYFSDQLSKDEEKLFEELLVSDPDFKKQFDFEKNLQKVIHNNESSNLKSKLIDFEKEIVKEVPVKSLKPNFRKWSLAASIALLATLGWLTYTNMTGPNLDGLFDDNFQEYPNTVFEITRGEGSESLERDAFSAYEIGDYKTAIENFDKIKLDQRPPYFNFYLSQSYLNTGELEKAKSLLQETISSKESFVAESYWYLALIAIKENEKEKAMEYLNVLCAKYDYNKTAAEKLLEELE